MKFINIRADGTVLDSMEGVKVPYNDRTAPFYEALKRGLEKCRPYTGRKDHDQNLQTPPQANQSRKDAG